MSNEQDKAVNEEGRQAVSMELVIKEYEVVVQDLLRENVMLKALMAQKKAEEGNLGVK